MLRNVVDGTADPRHTSPSALTNTCKQHPSLFTMHFVQPFYKSTTETAHLTCTLSHSNGRHCQSYSNNPPPNTPPNTNNCDIHLAPCTIPTHNYIYPHVLHKNHIAATSHQRIAFLHQLFSLAFSPMHCHADSIVSLSTRLSVLT